MPIELIKALVKEGYGFACLTNDDDSAHAIFIIASDASIWCDMNMGRYYVLDLEAALAAQKAGGE